MTTVLSEVAAKGTLSDILNLQAYVNEARPAFQKAMSDQLVEFDR